MLILAIGLTGLVLMMVVRSTIVRERRRFGILKALGYTSGQLMRQIAVGADGADRGGEAQGERALHSGQGERSGYGQQGWVVELHFDIDCGSIYACVIRGYDGEQLRVRVCGEFHCAHLGCGCLFVHGGLLFGDELVGADGADRGGEAQGSPTSSR